MLDQRKRVCPLRTSNAPVPLRAISEAMGRDLQLRVLLCLVKSKSADRCVSATTDGCGSECGRFAGINAYMR